MWRELIVAPWQSQGGTDRWGLHRPKLDAIMMSLRLPLLSVAAPLSSRLSRYSLHRFREPLIPLSEFLELPAQLRIPGHLGLVAQPVHLVAIALRARRARQAGHSSEAAFHRCCLFNAASRPVAPNEELYLLVAAAPGP